MTEKTETANRHLIDAYVTHRPACCGGYVSGSGSCYCLRSLQHGYTKHIYLIHDHLDFPMYVFQCYLHKSHTESPLSISCKHSRISCFSFSVRPPSFPFTKESSVTVVGGLSVIASFEMTLKVVVSLQMLMYGCVSFVDLPSFIIPMT